MNKQKLETKNKMDFPRLEKVILSCGATGPNLEKSKKLLDMLTNKKAQIVNAGPKRRIPAFGVKPGLALGTMVTLRGKEAEEILKRLLTAVDQTVKRKQLAPNAFSFGIQEYIEIPGIEYQRDIGIRGLNVTVVFSKPGVRVKRKKIKSGRLPHRHNVSVDEIASFMKEKFNMEAI